MDKRFIFAAFTGLIVASTLVHAQTLNQQISRGATFFTPQIDYQGMAAIQNAQSQANQAAAQRRLIEEQTRALQFENNRREAKVRETQNPDEAQVMSPYVQQWLKSAQPRMHLFPNFEQVVFSQDVAISDDMIKMMAGSPYAADIAYYLGTHKMEAVAIKGMPMLDAARSISDIEKRLMGTAPKAK